jgi:hypothetical protein
VSRGVYSGSKVSSSAAACRVREEKMSKMNKSLQRKKVAGQSRPGRGDVGSGKDTAGKGIGKRS